MNLQYSVKLHGYSLRRGLILDSLLWLQQDDQEQSDKSKVTNRYSPIKRSPAFPFGHQIDFATKAKKHYQLTDDQISTVKTAEEVMILNDALKWRELQSGKTKAKQKVEGARPVVKSAAKRSAQAGKVSRAKKAEATMREKGDIDSVANFLLS